ncbi:hypothetical protein [Streptococcus pneumoniae]|uniref:hypothetical protein n=1 Tax=Streptococcus pneumoniae TaxID=1313 RepID=UPI0008DDE517|nr:hypothetical protein [Streptococcus pneumoniae]OIB13345.1 hypothetical protein A2G61_09220 [Streptococcus pneumoniae]
MIIQLSDLGQVHLVCSKIDMRQGIDSLAYVVKTHFELDLENGRLTWPSTEKDVKALTPEQVDWLMKGFSITPQI